jgi:hypothetical protein
MSRRIGALTAAAVLVLGLTACGAGSGTDAHSGGSTGGGTTGGGNGGAAAGDGASPNMKVDGATAAAGNFGANHSNTSDNFDGCKIWFGFSQSGSTTYLVSASKDGIGGHVQWKCNQIAVGVDRLRITAHLEWAYTLGGTYTTEDTSKTSGGGTNSAGNLFPLTDHCTSDWWRVRVTIGWDETGSGPQTRPDLVSESRKVTDEDCNRN